MSQLFVSGGQSIVASASVLPMNIQGWFPLGLIGLISLQSKGLKSPLQHHNSKASVLQHSTFFMVQLSHPYMTTGKNTALTVWTFVGKVNSLPFNTLFVIAYQAEKWRRSFRLEETAQAIQGLGRSLVCIGEWRDCKTWQVVMSGF